MYTFACDGKPYPTFGTQTVACTKAGPSEYDFAYTANGKTLESEVDTLSADGTSMVAAETVQRADGTKETSSDTYSRVSGTGGLAGTWKDVKSSSDSSFSFDLATSSSGLTLSVPEYKETIALKLDGSPSPVTGPNVSPGEVWIAKSVRSNGFTANEEIAGKSISDFDFALNPDGKTMVVSIWAPGKESEKNVYLYVKQ
jgi:hypothetical protein